MIASLKKGEEVEIRLLQQPDGDNLYHYLQELSAESRSRFGPHSFDHETVTRICNHLPGDTQRYIAIDNKSHRIIAYMLLKQGMIEWDEQRYAEKQHHFDASTTVTFAPSVADNWQSSGLGTLMNTIIEHELKMQGKQIIVLWGGVQATNEKAVNFYKKLGYQYMGSFWHEGKDNYDMIKPLM